MRSFLTLFLLFGLACTCGGVDPFGSRVAFDLEKTTFTAGEPVEVELLYLKEDEGHRYEVGIASTSDAAPLVSQPITRDTRAVTLVAPAPGSYSVVIRRDDQMIAHRKVVVE
jgi:hypothetical protein